MHLYKKVNQCQRQWGGHDNDSTFFLQKSGANKCVN